MKKLLLAVILSATLLAHAHAEMFFGPTSATNHLLVGKGQFIAINSALASALGPGDPKRLVIIDGSAYLTWVNLRFLAGPGELVFSNTVSIINFSRFTNGSVKNLVVGPGMEPEIEVPDGQTVKFLGAPNNGVDVAVTHGGKVYPFVTMPTDPALSGPMKLHFKMKDEYLAQPAFDTAIFSYFLTDSLSVLQAQGRLVPLPGQAFISVEKSPDLSAWLPVIDGVLSSDEKAFYRLRITK